MAFSIRPYQPADLAACRALWVDLTEQHRILYHDPGIGGSDPGAMFDQYLALPDLVAVWVADEGGQAIGMAGLIVHGEEAEIEPVVVTSNYRSRGIGKQLIAEALSEAKRRGIRFLGVRPVARNRQAIEFFIENGFHLVGQIELFQELTTPGAQEWRRGIELHGHELGY